MIQTIGVLLALVPSAVLIAHFVRRGATRRERLIGAGQAWREASDGPQLVSFDWVCVFASPVILIGIVGLTLFHVAIDPLWLLVGLCVPLWASVRCLQVLWHRPR